MHISFNKLFINVYKNVNNGSLIIFTLNKNKILQHIHDSMNYLSKLASIKYLYLKLIEIYTLISKINSLGSFHRLSKFF